MIPTLDLRTTEFLERPAFVAEATEAEINYFVIGSDPLNRWSNPNNWSLGHVPINGERAYAYGGGYSVLGDMPSNVTLDSARADALVNHVTTNLLTANEFALGVWHPGSWRLSNGTVNAGAAYIGAFDSIGLFEQFSGKSTFGGFLSVGESPDPDAFGTFNINGGTMQTGELDVGYRGGANFRNFGGMVIADLYGVGYLDGGEGTIEMGAGTILAFQAFVGGPIGGAGTFIHNGGQHTILDYLDIGRSTNGGTYFLQNGTFLVNDLAIDVFSNGKGDFYQSGGVLNCGSFYVGENGFAQITGGTASIIFLELDGKFDITNRGFSMPDTSNSLNLNQMILTGKLSSSFGTNTAVGYTQTQVLSTIFGDANLDRTVDIADFSIIGSHFNQTGKWYEGDFNYDGTINIADFSILASNFNKAFDPNRSIQVPETSLIAFGIILPLIRRRK